METRTRVFVNRIACAVPEHEVHRTFLHQVPKYLDQRQSKLFAKLSARSQMERRYSVLPEILEFYRQGDFPSTSARMDKYKQYAWPLAEKALAQLQSAKLPETITHLIVTSCTGFTAPGIDIEIVQRLGLAPTVERTLIGFMGCYAAVNGLKQAYHIVRSQPQAKVLLLNLELCTLHFQDSDQLETMMNFLIFADGCAASVISAESSGIELTGFYNSLALPARAAITWDIGDSGFTMHLSTEVPELVGKSLSPQIGQILRQKSSDQIKLWALHPGGRAILDAIQKCMTVPEEKMIYARRVLRDYGNMSSATVMFVLAEILRDVQASGPGCGMAFGPGLAIESFTFHKDLM